MEDTKTQKPRIDTFFRGAKIVQLVSYLRFEFNIDFMYEGVSLCVQVGAWYVRQCHAPS